METPLPSNEDERFTIHVSGTGLTVEREVSFETAWLVISRLFERPEPEERRAAPAPVAPAVPPVSSLRGALSADSRPVVGERPAALAFEQMRRGNEG